MNEKNTGGPAFPFAFSAEDRVSDGMTLRDHFAGLAMQAFILARATLRNDHAESFISSVDSGTTAEMFDLYGDMGVSFAESVSQDAYDLADTMLELRLL